MNDRMPAPSSGAIHWVRKPGYIKGEPHKPVCGIGDKLNGYTSVSEPQYQFRVTCEHCLYWLWDQEQPARKMDIDQRVVNMRFDSVEIDVEGAIERGIRAGLAKVQDDFFNSDAVKLHMLRQMKTAVRSVLTEPATRSRLKNLAEGGITNALQRADVRQTLIGIHKIAEDELDEEFDDDKLAEDRRREIREVLETVLDERGLTGAGVGTQFTQNIYSPEGFDPEALKHVIKEAIAEDDEEQLDGYEKNETALIQKAVTSVLVSDQFQDLFKKLVKVAIDEGRVAETKLVHQRKLYSTDGICGATSGEFSPLTRQVTCQTCKRLNLQ